MSELRQKAEGETLKAGLDRNKKFDEADKAQANRLANDQATTQAQTMQLGDRLQQLVQKMNENKSPDGGLKQTADQVQKDLKQAADSPMREAKQNIDAAKDPAQDPKASAPQQAKDAQQRSAIAGQGRASPAESRRPASAGNGQTRPDGRSFRSHQEHRAHQGDEQEKDRKAIPEGQQGQHWQEAGRIEQRTIRKTTRSNPTNRTILASNSIRP